VEKTVTLAQVMTEIKTGRPFDISFVTADRNKGKAVRSGTTLSAAPQEFP